MHNDHVRIADKLVWPGVDQDAHTDQGTNTISAPGATPNFRVRERPVCPPRTRPHFLDAWVEKVARHPLRRYPNPLIGEL